MTVQIKHVWRYASITSITGRAGALQDRLNVRTPNPSRRQIAWPNIAYFIARYGTVVHLGYVTWYLRFARAFQQVYRIMIHIFGSLGDYRLFYLSQHWPVPQTGPGPCTGWLIWQVVFPVLLNFCVELILMLRCTYAHQQLEPCLPL